MNYQYFYLNLKKFNLISDIWNYVLSFIEEEISIIKNKDEIISLFAIYFSLIDDGNLCLNLNKDELFNKWDKKVKGNRILLLDKETNLNEYDCFINYSFELIDSYLGLINEENLTAIIGKDKILQIDNGWLYVRKYNLARKGVISSLKRLFVNNRNSKKIFNYKLLSVHNFELEKEQEDITLECLNKNLIITGGPGTGKTTSILFLLLNMLEEQDFNVYLAAPSGKASNRMKESILDGLNVINDDYKNKHPELIERIKNLESKTIHSLLGVDFMTNGFIYNKFNQFPSNSLFIIDEASMIDICLFNSLLSALPNDARLFIMGDKNQLPSVESGSVFSELLKCDYLKDNVIEVKKSKRFKQNSSIFNLAYAVNEGSELPIKKEDWQDYKNFEIIEDSSNYPIYYYSNESDSIKEKEIIDSIISKWASYFYKTLQDKCIDLDPADLKQLKDLYNYSESSKILCAENLSVRGVISINKMIKKQVIDINKTSSLQGHYPGQIMMINSNNKALDLANGDSGILVTFKGDKTIYFMCQKSTALVSKDKKEVDRIFKLGEFTFYPLRLISKDEIDLAYAISIHKSQGSGYKNILVILPSKKGHPLLNRQIIYTAITRTKGSTYLLSNMDRLNEGKDTILYRDTNIACD